jgi:MFS family permease
MNLGGIVLAAVFGFVLSKKFSRLRFLRVWLITGIPLSLLPLAIDLSALSYSIGYFFVSGVYFGFGMPVALAYFASATKETNRAKRGGITFLVSFVTVFLLSLLGITDIALNVAVLAACQALVLASVFVIKPPDFAVPQKDGSFAVVFKNRAFVLYFLPWLMFSMVNYIGEPLVSQIFPNLFQQFMLIENLLAGVVAVVTGFVADRIGRKRLVLTGFVLLGLGYGSLGLFAENLASWWFYTVVDGVSWGIFYTIFLMTIWGDIAKGKNSERFYAIGYLPFLFSIFAEVSIGPAIASIVSHTAIFSFTSLFLFFAILPLTYAPETVSRKILENRELQEYIKKAQRTKMKFKN